MFRFIASNQDILFPTIRKGTWRNSVSVRIHTSRELFDRYSACFDERAPHLATEALTDFMICINKGTLEPRDFALPIGDNYSGHVVVIYTTRVTRAILISKCEKTGTPVNDCFNTFMAQFANGEFLENYREVAKLTCIGYDLYNGENRVT